MYLLYLDGSGSVKDPSQQYFVLGGVCVFERQGWWLSQELEKVAARFNPADSTSIELHGSPMLQGRNGWRSFPVADRIQALKDSLHVLARSHISNRAFAVAVEKAAVSPEDPVVYAFEQMVSRFDQFLMRRHKAQDTQRGIVIFDKSTHEQTLQGLTTAYRGEGHRYGVLRNLAEVPLFLDSQASRLVQLADLVSYGTYRKFEKSDSQFFDVFQHRLDAEGGVVHGLHHRQS